MTERTDVKLKCYPWTNQVNIICRVNNLIIKRNDLITRNL